MTTVAARAIPGWLPALRSYLLVSGFGNLIWETLQIPLYTLWRTGSARDIAFAVVHCTGGDVVIATASLVVALVVVGERGWPEERLTAVALVTGAVGFAYTGYSEWMNTAIRGTWAYSPHMPVLPWLGIGLSPLLQWLVVPGGALYAAQRAGLREGDERER
jgi:hypothetical protein